LPGETEVFLYMALKKFLASLGWVTLAGQPPSGSDHIPVVEIKDPALSDKGSRGSYKPDLVALRSDELFVFEVKPGFSSKDYKKLVSIADSKPRQEALTAELVSRGLLNVEIAADILTRGKMCFALVNSDAGRLLDVVWQFNYHAQGFTITKPIKPNSE
jgi:hypothetical protein